MPSTGTPQNKVASFCAGPVDPGGYPGGYPGGSTTRKGAQPRWVKDPGGVLDGLNTSRTQVGHPGGSPAQWALVLGACMGTLHVAVKTLHADCLGIVPQ